MREKKAEELLTDRSLELPDTPTSPSALVSALTLTSTKREREVNLAVNQLDFKKIL